MPRKNKIYEFDDFYIDENERRLYRLGEPVQLQPKAFDILFLLVRNAGAFVTVDEIIDALWDAEKAENNVVTVQMVTIRKALREEKKGDLIEARRKAYKFVRAVNIREVDISKVTRVEPAPDETRAGGDHSSANFWTELAERSEIADLEDVGLDVSDRHGFVAFGGTLYALTILLYGLVTRMPCEKDCFDKYAFIVIAGFSLALVTAACLMLEGAYRFDRFKWRTLLFLPVVFLINGGSMFTSLLLIGNYSENLALSLAAGVICLVGGLIVSTILARELLPDVPVTAATFQTQQAFNAFCKNVFIYILPLYTIFCLLINVLLFSGQNDLFSPLYPVGFFAVWLLSLLFSRYGTNYLLTNLSGKKSPVNYPYHGLFTALIFIRFILFFGTTFVFILWYFIKTITFIPAGDPIR